jgi:glycosyltransferase involved in cell wall biosynthesis
MPPERARDVALIVTPQYLPFLGGMERECALLARELRRRGWRPVIVTEQLGLDTPLEEEDDHGAHVHRIPSSPRRTLRVQLAAAARMARIVLRYRRSAAFAIVRTATLPAVLVGLLKKLRLVRFPTLVTAETGGVADDVVALANRPLFPVSRALVSSHDVLNGLCRANVDHLREHGFPEAKISSIPNGIDTSAWAATEPPARVERFLFLGRLDPEKGLFELLDAFAALRADHPRVRLRVAGEGPARADLERRIVELGIGDAVELPGLVPYDELGALFDSIDCVVLPSYSEGMPLSVLEAAAHHRVLIVSDVGDIPELFGERIRVVPPRDGGALHDAMRAAVEDDSPDADYGDVVERVAIGTVADQMLARLGARK